MQRPKQFNSEPYDYHEEVILRIDTLTNLGIGLGRIDNWVVMVAFTLPGELVKAKIFRNAKNYSDADLVEVIEPSSSRIAPACKLFTECGGCQYQHMDYNEQLKWKTDIVAELIERLAETSFPVKPTIGSPKQYAYRSKLTPHYPKLAKSTLPIGFLRHGSRRSIVDVPQCPIATEEINEALPLERASLPAKLKGKKRGGTLLLRHCIEGIITDPTLTVTERIGDIIYQFQAGEFFQNNPYILPLLIDYVVTEAKTDQINYLVDAYCGVGVFSLAGNKHFKECTGVEINANAIKWAHVNATINNINNCKFIIGEAENIFERISYPAEETAMVIDPPRKGCDVAFIKQLINYNPNRIVYVSCAPDTQARDIKMILEEGYKIISVQPFDLFPQTRHIESIITLSRE